MKKLLGQGVSASCCDYDKRSPLMVSAQEGKESIVKLLVESKANVHALDIFGGNALLGAVKMGHQSVIEVLMEHDARCGPRDEKGGPASASSTNLQSDAGGTLESLWESSWTLRDDGQSASGGTLEALWRASRGPLEALWRHYSDTWLAVPSTALIRSS